MKKNILALSLALFLPVTTTSFAQEQQSSDPNETVEQETTEQYLVRMRPEIIRLYPDYVKDDLEDTMFYQYLEHHQRRQQDVPFFNQAQRGMQKYLMQQKMPKLRPLDPDQSKLDALVYEDLSQIYTEIERIQQHVNPYVKFNQTILQQVDWNAPLPAFSEQDDKRYNNAIDSMYATYKKQANTLAGLVNKVDIYRQKIEEFQNIASKKVYKAHLENINQLNMFTLVLGRFLNVQLKAEDAISMGSRAYNQYQAEDHPLWAQKFTNYLNSQQNQQRTQALLLNLPDQNSLYGADTLAQKLEKFNKIKQRCQTKWFDENDVKFVVNGRLDQVRIDEYCQKNEQALQQVLTDDVQVQALSYQSSKIPNLNFLGDFRVYADNLYYTDTEKNAVYRFDTKSLKEQLIYQHALNIEHDGCSHNMCRGVGATDVVLSKNGKIAYVASLDYNQVFAIDLSNNQVIQKYDVERYPRKLLLDEKGENLFVYNGVANSISKIQLESGKIQTQALPDSHQGHFCREIDLSFSPISGDIKILGDWPTDPYIYMNSENMHFYQSDIEVPYHDLYLHDDYQYIVKVSDRNGEVFSVYDIRLNRLTKQVVLRSDKSDEDAYSRTWDHPNRLYSMGNLVGIGQYFVEKISEKTSVLDQEDGETTQDSYIFHLQQNTRTSAQNKITFKLAFQPYKIVALGNQRIMVLGAEDGYLQPTPTSEMVIYDLNSAHSKSILATNSRKLQAQNELTFEDLTQEERY